MSLTGSNNEEKIYNYLISKIPNIYGVCGLMGNLFAESGLKSTNLQNSYEQKLGMNDDQYTTSVDNGDYQNFVYDKAGYGLAQWTYYSRKQNLLNFCRQQGKSIGDLEAQLEFLFIELKGYKNVFNVLNTATSVKQASNVVLLEFERPANQGVEVQNKRAEYGMTYFAKFSKEEKEEFTMSNSSLVTCRVMSPNHSGKRTHKIDRITPHCVVGQLSASSIGGCFTSTSRQASCNYGIGTDGDVSLIVDEANRSWCSSSNANDQRAVTIECASDKTEPYAMNSKVYNKLVELCVDICKRNGKNKLIWIADKDKALAYEPKDNEMLITVHRWFANKSCPGDWLYSRLDDLANKVTAQLGNTSSSTSQTPQNTTSNTLYRVQTGAYSKKENAVAQYNAVKSKGFDAIIVQVNGLYKVQVGAYSVKKNADNMLSTIKKAGFDAFITTAGGTQVSASVEAPKKTLTTDSRVKIKSGAKDLNSNRTFASFVYKNTYDVISISGDKVVFGIGKAVTGVVSKSNVVVQ